MNSSMSRKYGLWNSGAERKRKSIDRISQKVCVCMRRMEERKTNPITWSILDRSVKVGRARHLKVYPSHESVDYCTRVAQQLLFVDDRLFSLLQRPLYSCWGNYEVLLCPRDQLVVVDCQTAWCYLNSRVNQSTVIVKIYITIPVLSPADGSEEHRHVIFSARSFRSPVNWYVWRIASILYASLPATSLSLNDLLCSSDMRPVLCNCEASCNPNTSCCLFAWGNAGSSITCVYAREQKLFFFAFERILGNNWCYILCIIQWRTLRIPTNEHWMGIWFTIVFSIQKELFAKAPLCSTVANRYHTSCYNVPHLSALYPSAEWSSRWRTCTGIRRSAMQAETNTVLSTLLWCSENVLTSPTTQIQAAGSCDALHQ